MKITINDTCSFNVDLTGKMPVIDGEPFEVDISRTGKNTYHLIRGTSSYRVEILEHDRSAKTAMVLVNDKHCRLSASGKYDELLASLGIDLSGSSKMTEQKAPMPGLVLHLFIKEGDEVSKGDPLVTLEAMKMENILRAPGDGTVKSIKVQLGSKVEKGQVLITFA